MNPLATDHDWLLNKMPSASDAECERFIERVGIKLNDFTVHSLAVIEAVRNQALDEMAGA